MTTRKEELIQRELRNSVQNKKLLALVEVRVAENSSKHAVCFNNPPAGMFLGGEMCRLLQVQAQAQFP